MTERHLEKLQGLFRVRFDEIMWPKSGVWRHRTLSDSFDEWSRWLKLNQVDSIGFDDNQRCDTERRARIHSPTGFQILLVPLNLAEKALALGTLP